jgi:thioredoxin 1
MARKIALIVLVLSSLQINSCIQAITQQKNIVAAKNISTVSDFDREINNNRITVVKFWRYNCPPCTASETMFQSLAQKYHDISFVKVNVLEGDGQTLVSRYNLKGVPTFMIFKNTSIIFNNRNVSEIEHALNDYTQQK